MRLALDKLLGFVYASNGTAKNDAVLEFIESEQQKNEQHKISVYDICTPFENTPISN